MFVLVTVYRYATEEKSKRQLRKAFQLYLNPEVLEEMLLSKTLKAERLCIASLVTSGILICRK